MSKRHNKTDLVNLGDPLPLTYLPTRRQSPSQSYHRQHQQQSRQPSGSLQQSTSIEPLPPPTTKPTTSSLLSRLANNPAPQPLPHVRIPRTSTTKDRIKNKLRQLIHELNELETYEEEQLIIMEQQLNDISDHLIRINTTESITNMHEQEIDNEQEEQEEEELLNYVKTNISRLRSQNENQQQGIYKLLCTFCRQQKYLILGISILIISFLISSLIVADFKYQYCYYFC
ncbi:hypothetical protein MEW_02170 [Candida albicans P60002]|uniref:Uncharacterized protein n=1 Tax=Candida albicans TaxID=5476 RepID=A0A8H6F1Y1_CANAX|nr:hypothetical protein FOB64_005397 [Candida albicans]KHC53897.1 hypothetical protein MEW_02170 [Candida albicans P60002]